MSAIAVGIAATGPGDASADNALGFMGALSGDIWALVVGPLTRGNPGFFAGAVAVRCMHPGVRPRNGGRDTRMTASWRGLTPVVAQYV
jgi:hypothetical protein